MMKQVLSVLLKPECEKLLRSTLHKQQIGLHACVSENEAQRALQKESYCLAVIDTSSFTKDKAVQSIVNLRLDTYAPILTINNEQASEQILDAGADMSFHISEEATTVVNHAMALIRRYTLYNLYDELKPDGAVLHRGNLIIDPIRHRVSLSGKEIHLQPREFRLLLHFARNPGIVVTPDRICESIWQSGYDRNRDVSAVIAELRRKLDDTKDHPTYIATVHGFGYKFLPQT